MCLHRVVLGGLAALMFHAPATSSARTDCAYATPVLAGGPLYVEAQATPDSSGTSNQADAAVGVCVDGLSSITPGFDGGLVEVGHGAPPITERASGPVGNYVIFDGDDANTFITDGTGGYVGLSNFETGAKSPCGTTTGSGTNSGGCLTIRGFISVPVPLLACGNTDGKSWHVTMADGCTLP